jgi:Holliday junction DNA helicase RuvA
MIGYLRGVVAGVLPGGIVLLDVAGVGYEVTLASPSTTVDGDDMTVFVHTAVRADAITLYGFLSLAERALFTALLATPGVGPSTAVAALRTLGGERLSSAIAAGDASVVATVPGIGAKTAQRIVLELKDKVGTATGTPAAAAAVRDDVLEALRALGYQNSEIRTALRDVDLPTDEAEALRVALQYMGRR